MALQQMIEDHKKMENEPPKPKMSIEEKNRKKVAAIEATREDGKKLFKEGKLREAIQIYERGVLICNGIYDLSDEDWKAVQRHEMLLDLNVATCHLKLKEYQEAIRHCKMALAIDKKCMKALYRMAQAHVGIGELDKAQASLENARELEPKSSALATLGQTIKQLKKKQREKAKEFRRQMAAKMAKKMGKTVANSANQDLDDEKTEAESGKDEGRKKRAGEAEEAMQLVEKLERLAKLHKDGMISSDEYGAAKRQLIGL